MARKKSGGNSIGNINELPPQVKNATSDHVKYGFKIPSGVEKQFSAVCYAAHMDRLPKGIFYLYPNITTNWIHEKASCLPGECFIAFIDMCKKNGLIPKEVKIKIVDGQNRLVVDGKKFDRHLVYSTLCCYRWSDSKAAMVYNITHALMENPRLNFWCVLYYWLLKSSLNYNHTFLPGMSGYNYNVNISNVLALKYFFSDDCKRSGYWGKCWRESSRNKIAEISQKFGKFMVKRKDLLTNKFDPLFKIKKVPTNKMISQIYERCNV